MRPVRRSPRITDADRMNVDEQFALYLHHLLRGGREFAMNGQSMIPPRRAAATSCSRAPYPNLRASLAR